MIRHTVVFTLKEHKSPSEAPEFFAAAKALAAIPGVQNFECLRQVSKKNNFEFGLSMEFANATLYEGYNTHPEHVRFIQQYWLNEVDDFLEIDYEPMS